MRRVRSPTEKLVFAADFFAHGCDQSTLEVVRVGDSSLREAGRQCACR